ncbi:SAM-dependent methyltransferase [Streptomyces sp. NBC_01476]
MEAEVRTHYEGLTATDEGERISYVHADVREPEKILEAARGHLDFDRRRRSGQLANSYCFERGA